MSLNSDCDSSSAARDAENEPASNQVCLDFELDAVLWSLAAILIMS